MTDNAVDLHDTIYRSKNRTRRWLHEVRKLWIQDRIAQFARQRSTGVQNALEIGPGGGEYLPLLTAIADRVTVTDVSGEFLRHARAKFAGLGNIRYVEDDITNSRLKPASYDLILCSEVIEHIPDAHAPLAAIRSLLKPDGNAIITTPQKYATLELVSKIAFLPGIIDVVRAMYREPVTPTGHINLRTRRTVRAQLTAHGLAILDEEVLALYLPFVAELLGDVGLRIQQVLSRRWRAGVLSNLLWTQCYRVGLSRPA